jgi:hypothetical protein
LSVIRRSPLPSLRATKISVFVFVTARTNAIRPPSGENAGSDAFRISGRRCRVAVS